MCEAQGPPESGSGPALGQVFTRDNGSKQQDCWTEKGYDERDLVGSLGRAPRKSA